MIRLERADLHPPNLQARSLRTSLQNFMRGTKAPVSSFPILSDINLDLTPGTRLGLIGPNGAGKSSLLRLMAGVYYPTYGRVSREGRTLTMIDLHFGMDEEASGYKNLEIAGALLGLDKHVISQLTPQIEKFSELGEALQHPIKIYSSGMRLRLAFSLITSIQASNLLIDEIIGVGDAYFLKKATQRIRDKLDETNVLVLASHADSVLSDFCATGIVMADGRIVYHGKIDDALSFYHQQIETS